MPQTDYYHLLHTWYNKVKTQNNKLVLLRQPLPNSLSRPLLESSCLYILYISYYCWVVTFHHLHRAQRGEATARIKPRLDHSSDHHPSLCLVSQVTYISNHTRAILDTSTNTELQWPWLSTVSSPACNGAEWLDFSPLESKYPSNSIKIFIIHHSTGAQVTVKKPATWQPPEGFVLTLSNVSNNVGCHDNLSLIAAALKHYIHYYSHCMYVSSITSCTC